MDASIVSVDELRAAHARALSIDPEKDHDLATSVVAHLYAISPETVAEALEQQHAGT